LTQKSVIFNVHLRTTQPFEHLRSNIDVKFQTNKILENLVILAITVFQTTLLVK